MELGVEAYGIDYAEVATRMSLDVIHTHSQVHPEQHYKTGVCRADAKKLPFPTGYFDRVLLFDVVEHLYPWELHEALLDIHRILKPNGRLMVHTAPNRWYDAYGLRYG